MKLGKSIGSLTKIVKIYLKNPGGEDYLKAFAPDEEDGGVVADYVPVALLRVELHCKPTRVPVREDAVVTVKHCKTAKQH